MKIEEKRIDLGDGLYALLAYGNCCLYYPVAPEEGNWVRDPFTDRINLTRQQVEKLAGALEVTDESQD